MSKRSEELRQQLSQLLAAQALPGAQPDDEEAIQRVALMRAVARTRRPKGRTFSPHKAHAPQTRPSKKGGGGAIDSSHD